MQKWEYKTITLGVGLVDAPGFNANLNLMGQEGWELIKVAERGNGITTSGDLIFIFKKEIV